MPPLRALCSVAPLFSALTDFCTNVTFDAHGYLEEDRNGSVVVATVGMKGVIS